MAIYDKALVPEDLGRFFIERLNEGDVDGLLMLYEDAAIMAMNTGTEAHDRDGLREIFERLVYDLVVREVVFSSESAPTLRRDDLALIARRFNVNYMRMGQQTTVRTGTTNEVAHLQPNGTWLYIMTQILFNN